MSFQDQDTMVSEDQDLAQTAGTYVSTNSIDLGLSTIQPGMRTAGYANHWMDVYITETFTTGGGAATIQAQLISDDAANLGSPTVIATGVEFALADAVAGATLASFFISLKEIDERHLGVQYIIGTATTTAGTATASVVETPRSNNR